MSRMMMMALVLAVALPVTAQETVRYEGLAYDVETGAFLYTESHAQWSGDAGPVLQTRYTDAEGAPFAARQVQFGQRPLTPDFELVDERSNYIEGAEMIGDKTRVYKREGGDVEESLIEPGRHPLVIDAGFDTLVQQSWDKLKKGETIRFDFLNADRLDRIPFRLKYLGSSESDDGPVSDFEMALGNPMLRWLLDSIQISYLDSDRRLYRYVGISNIKDPEGNNYTVRIEFPRDRFATEGTVVAAAQP